MNINPKAVILGANLEMLTDAEFEIEYGVTKQVVREATDNLEKLIRACEEGHPRFQELMAEMEWLDAIARRTVGEQHD